MIIFKFEIKRQRINCLIWTSAIVALLLGLMLKLYPIFEAGISEITKIMEGFPPEFAAAFGINAKSLFGFGGFYSFSFSYIALMGGIMAASLGLDSFSRENRSKCVDFLFTKPVSRERIFSEKFLSGLCILVLSNTIYVAATVMIGNSNDVNMLLPALSLFFTQSVFFALGIAYATFAKKVRSVSGMATAIGFTAFILSALINILEEEKLRFITPLKYFDPTTIFTNGSYELKYALTGICLAVVCIVSSFIHYIKSDSKSV